MQTGSEISVYYTVLNLVDSPVGESLLVRVPESMQREVLLYRKFDDQQRLLAGKFLLQKALHDFSSDRSLEDYRTDEMGRPFIGNFHDFNITHSGSVVACAVFPGGRTGIDVERIREIKPENFSKQFSPPELAQILSAPDTRSKFFEFWTQKEAVMKADGRGMRIPLHSIRLRGDYATIDDRDGEWNLYPLELQPGYKIHCCSTTANVSFRAIQVDVFTNISY